MSKIKEFLLTDIFLISKVFFLLIILNCNFLYASNSEFPKVISDSEIKYVLCSNGDTKLLLSNEKISFSPLKKVFIIYSLNSDFIHTDIDIFDTSCKKKFSNQIDRTHKIFISDSMIMAILKYNYQDIDEYNFIDQYGKKIGITFQWDMNNPLKTMLIISDSEFIVLSGGSLDLIYDINTLELTKKTLKNLELSYHSFYDTTPIWKKILSGEEVLWETVNGDKIGKLNFVSNLIELKILELANRQGPFVFNSTDAEKKTYIINIDGLLLTKKEGW